MILSSNTRRCFRFYKHMESLRQADESCRHRRCSSLWSDFNKQSERLQRSADRWSLSWDSRGLIHQLRQQVRGRSICHWPNLLAAHWTVTSLSLAFFSNVGISLGDRDGIFKMAFITLSVPLAVTVTFSPAALRTHGVSRALIERHWHGEMYWRQVGSLQLMEVITLEIVL